MRAPDVMSCPEEDSASELSPGGLPVPVGCPAPVCLALEVCPVPACLALEGCPVQVLSCLSSPRGLLIPPNFPREIFVGGRRVPAGVARPRDKAMAIKGHLPWPPELPAPPCPPELPAPPWPPELPAPPWPPEVPALPWPLSSVRFWRSPSCVPVRVCPEGPPECLETLTSVFSNISV